MLVAEGLATTTETALLHAVAAGDDIMFCCCT
jgi:hypothetical protein